MPAAGRAQDTLAPWNGGITFSLGQPERFSWYVAGTLGGDERPGLAGASVLGAVGLRQHLAIPFTGLLETSEEIFGGVRGPNGTGGLRAFVRVPVVGLSGGAEYDAREGDASSVFALTLPLERGGLLGTGSLIRAEWLPGRGAVRASVILPLGAHRAGKTRPRSTEVNVPERRTRLLPRPDAPPELDDALRNVRTAALRIEELVVPYVEAPGADPERALAGVIEGLKRRPSLPMPSDAADLRVDETVRCFHRELARAFSIAATGRALAPGDTTPAGGRIAREARIVLRERVLFPFNRLLGQHRSDETLRALNVFARGAFARVLQVGDLASDRRSDAVLYVFQELLADMETIRRGALATWGDDRLLWLPLQLAYLPEDHDTQAKLDDIVSEAVGQPFTDGNRVWYVVNGQLQAEVTRSILAARSYHVLWIHDFKGVTPDGRPDAMSLGYVVDAYLRALTDRVRSYDSVGVLPAYMIFIDQHYYDVNRGRLWLDVLEHPMDGAPRLPVDYSDFAARVADAQAELRAAVQGSALLQAERRQYGDDWLANLVRVHVSVTNPEDPSFRGPGVLPLIGLPDDVMRDHRKIAFYDISEDDPYRGMAIYTGMGIGEVYAAPTWEDRSVMAQGPALLDLKEEARQLLLSQGLRPGRIPFVLRPAPKGPAYDSLVRAEVARQRAIGWHDQRMMELHNETGYQDKPINVARAVLYSLMPRGAVIKTPDSIWTSGLYAALLAGSALRGVRVLVVAPSARNSSSPGWPEMSLAHDLLARLIVIQRSLGAELEASGGMLRTGIYNPDMGTGQVWRRLDAAYRNARTTPFMSRLFHVHSSVDSAFAVLTARLAREAATDTTLRDTVIPRLHLKATFFASREGWDSLVGRPELWQAIVAYATPLTPDAEHPGVLEAAQSLSDASLRLVRATRASLPPPDTSRIIWYLVVGSANQDYRSMYMDGEASVLLAGESAIVGLVDFTLLVNLTVWVDDLATLDALLPPPSATQRHLSRWLRPLL